jgi:hypothetical protein
MQILQAGFAGLATSYHTSNGSQGGDPLYASILQRQNAQGAGEAWRRRS